VLQQIHSVIIISSNSFVNPGFQVCA